MHRRRTPPPPRQLGRDDEMLRPREALWVAGYIEKKTITGASEAAGYAAPINLLKRDRVANAVGKRMEKIMARTEVTAERVIEELAKIAFSNIDDFLDDDYSVTEKPKRRKMASVQAVKVSTRLIPDSGGEEVETVELKMYDKLGALNALGRHFGLFKDRIEISGDLSARLDRATQRLHDDNTTIEHEPSSARTPEADTEEE